MTLKQLYEAIRAGRYNDSDNIYERVWVNTVEGFAVWHRL